ncbi:UNVERIFIED_CONTAM: hypothetical protein Sangu_2649100, partial [Sesamum angustifolium]
AQHILTESESAQLITPVTKDEIKEAFFYIDKDKSPGPNGYTVGFYKEAWPIIGEEIIRAVLEFFANGRLLKQINATLLAVIPKELFSGYYQQRLLRDVP